MQWRLPLRGGDLKALADQLEMLLMDAASHYSVSDLYSLPIRRVLSRFIRLKEYKDAQSSRH